MSNAQIVANRRPVIAPNSFLRLNIIDNGDGTANVYVEERPNSDFQSDAAAIAATGLLVTSPASSILPVVDTTPIIKGSGDATKLLRFEVDGFTTGTTRVITPPNSNTSIPIIAQTITITGPTAPRSYALPNADSVLVSGSGTNNTLPKFTTGASGILGDSIISDSGTGIIVAGTAIVNGRMGIGGSAIAPTTYLNFTFDDLSTGANLNVINVNVSRAADPGGGLTTGHAISVAYTAAVDAAGSDFYGCVYQPWNLSSHAVGKLIGVSSRVLNLGTAAEVRLLAGQLLNNIAGSTITTLKGLDISAWVNGGTVTNSYAIYIDNSVGVGGNKFAIYSLSTAPSLLTGDLSVAGLLKLGSTPVTINDVAGKILAAAINAPGADTQVVFNDAGALAGNAALVFNKATGRLTATSFAAGASAGVDGTFTSQDGKTITVTKGLITAIV